MTPIEGEDPVSFSLPLSVIPAHAGIQCRSLLLFLSFFSPSVILDIFNRESSVFGFLHLSSRHLMAPHHGACGRGGAPVPQILIWGEDCLSEASSAAHVTGTGAQAPEGPRPGANGFGSFCRNKRTSTCGDETPQKQNPGCPIKPGMTDKGEGCPNAFIPQLQELRHWRSLSTCGS